METRIASPTPDRHKEATHIIGIGAVGKILGPDRVHRVLAETMGTVTGEKLPGLTEDLPAYKLNGTVRVHRKSPSINVEFNEQWNTHPGDLLLTKNHDGKVKKIP